MYEITKAVATKCVAKFQCLTYLTKHVAPSCESQPKMLLLSCNVCDRVWDKKTSCIVRLRFCHQICRQMISAPNSASFCLKFGLLTTSLCLWGKLILSICVVWGELQVAAGCGGSPAYAPRNRFPVVGMRYGPLPLFNHSTPIDPPSRQSLRALSYPTVRDVTNELMGGLVNSLMITVRM